MKGNIGRQHVEANTTLPSAARLAKMVRPDPDDFAVVSIMNVVSCQSVEPDNKPLAYVRGVLVRIHLSDEPKHGGTSSSTSNDHQFHVASYRAGHEPFCI